MSAVAAVRADVTEDLTAAGLSVIDHVPKVLITPVVIMSTGDDYIKPSNTMNRAEMEVALELYAVAGTRANQATLDDLETMIETIAAKLGADFRSASAPHLVTLNGAAYVTSKIAMTTHYTIPLETE